MTLTDIIECLNKSIQASLKGHFVLQTSIIANPTIKIYKNINYTLWYITQDSKQPVLDLKFTERMPENDKQAVLELTGKKFIEELFRWLQCDSYKNIIKNFSNETT